MSGTARSCCAPHRATGSIETSGSPQVATAAPHDDVLLQGGRFVMGDGFGDGLPQDGERPVHEVVVSTFRIDRTCVTNAQFAAFVAATGYVTQAEIYGDSTVFAPAVAASKSDVIGVAGAPWWRIVRGADWSHPYGPLSNLDNLGDHPVVHVSHDDALTYCAWSGRSLPTEAEWELAARGGHAGRRFPWGNELELGGTYHANVWQGDFPLHNSAADGWLATAPVRFYEPNDFGLFQMIGNVWEWCADWFAADYYENAPLQDPSGPDSGQARVTRGGSFLCHHSYCKRYRVAARSANTPNSSTGNLGFRTVLRPVAQAA